MPLYRHIKSGAVSELSKASFEVLNSSQREPTFEPLTEQEAFEFNNPPKSENLVLSNFQPSPVRVVDVTSEVKEEVTPPAEETPPTIKVEKSEGKKVVSSKDLD